MLKLDDKKLASAESQVNELISKIDKVSSVAKTSYPPGFKYASDIENVKNGITQSKSNTRLSSGWAPVTGSISIIIMSDI